MVDPSIVSGVRDYLNRLSEKGITVSFGVIFGSQVSGRADKWSDIDLIVVSPQFDEDISRDSINKLWQVAARTDSRREPIPCGERQWREDTSCAIIEIARQHGSIIYAA